ncbi:MAG TPA: hypothetical protein VGK18_17295 [Propionicimonas sp.]|jgi:hypothetical protein|uniref:hypothetical protein n=1 Tax=Propionicimonas sp. TaxID=1955623 RepID=UPI002F3E591E
MPTNATSHVAVRHQTALVESVLGHSVDWSGLPDPSGYIAEVLGNTSHRPGAPAFGSIQLLGRNANYYRHAEHTSASLLELIAPYARDGRVTAPMIAWTEDGPSAEPGVHRVRGLTNTATLRAALSRRLDSLNPVAAFRLLDQPEIATIERSHRDYVVLSCILDRYTDSRLLAGAIWAHDIDFWHNAIPGEVEGAFALDIDTYRARFAGTGVSA